MELEHHLSCIKPTLSNVGATCWWGTADQVRTVTLPGVTFCVIQIGLYDIPVSITNSMKLNGMFAFGTMARLCRPSRCGAGGPKLHRKTDTNKLAQLLSIRMYIGGVD